MRLIYTKPKLRDLSQGSRIAFARQFRFMTQDQLSDKLGLTGECKRRTMTRYEKGIRNPKDDRTNEISRILNVSFDAIKKYDFKREIDIIYTLLWLEELIPNYQIELEPNFNLYGKNNLNIDGFLDEWEKMRLKRKKRYISYEEYIEWKLNYSIENKEL